MASSTLRQLLSRLQNTQYTRLTPEEMQKQASSRYRSAYDQKRLSARQAHDAGDQALARQLAGLQETYDRQRGESAEAYAQASSQADRKALGRGMQRSSYHSASQANLLRAGAEAQQEISRAQTAQEKEIADQRTLAAHQLAQQLAQYDASQQADEQAYVDELEAREYDRSVQSQNAANELAMSIYQAQFAQEQAAQQQANWQADMRFQQAESQREQQNWQTSLDYQKAQDAQTQQNWAQQFEQTQQNWLREYNQTQQNWQSSLDYQKAKDAQAQQNWAQEFAFQQSQAAQEQENWLRKFNAAYSSKSSSGGGKRKSSKGQEVRQEKQNASMLSIMR